MQKPPLILLAEDDPNDIELFKNALRREGLEQDVAVARDGEEALDFLFRQGRFGDVPAGNPIVVLLDLKLPKIDGLEVLRQVKSDPALKSVPIVALTSSRMESDMRESYMLGVNGYIVKPMNYAEFQDIIRTLVAFWTRINEPPPGSVKKE